VLKPHLCCLKIKVCYHLAFSYPFGFQLLQNINLSGSHAQKPTLFHISYIQHCLKEIIEKKSLAMFECCFQNISFLSTQNSPQDKKQEKIFL